MRWLVFNTDKRFCFPPLPLSLPKLSSDTLQLRHCLNFMASCIHNEQQDTNKMTLLLTRIRSKWGCSSGGEWCNMQLGPQIEWYGWFNNYKAMTFALRKDNVGYVWYITKVGNYFIEDLIIIIIIQIVILLNYLLFNVHKQ